MRFLALLAFLLVSCGYEKRDSHDVDYGCPSCKPLPYEVEQPRYPEPTPCSCKCINNNTNTNNNNYDLIEDDYVGDSNQDFVNNNNNTNNNTINNTINIGKCPEGDKEPTPEEPQPEPECPKCPECPTIPKHPKFPKWPQDPRQQDPRQQTQY